MAMGHVSAMSCIYTEDPCDLSPQLGVRLFVILGRSPGFQEDREMVAKLRPLARFCSPEDHDELVDNLLLAKKMR